jgi:hypothetical protein
MQVIFHEIVDMATVRNRFVTAADAMSVLSVVHPAGVARGTSSRIRAALAQGMFIHVSRVRMRLVKVAVVEIIDVLVQALDHSTRLQIEYRVYHLALRSF